VVRKWNVIVWKGILFLFSVSWHHLPPLQTHWASVSLKSCPVWSVFVYVLTACVFVTRDTVRHPRRFVFGKLVHKTNCSWSEAFVNRGLTVSTYYILCISWIIKCLCLQNFLSYAWRKNTNKMQQYRWFIVNCRYWLLTTVSTCFGHLYVHHREKRPCVTAYGVYFTVITPST